MAVTELTLSKHDHKVGAPYGSIDNNYIGDFDYEEDASAVHLTTFEEESTVPPITDFNDDLGSSKAAFDRFGVTEYRAGDSSLDSGMISMGDGVSFKHGTYVCASDRGEPRDARKKKIIDAKAVSYRLHTSRENQT